MFAALQISCSKIERAEVDNIKICIVGLLKSDPNKTLLENVSSSSVEFDCSVFERKAIEPRNPYVSTLIKSNYLSCLLFPKACVSVDNRPAFATDYLG